LLILSTDISASQETKALEIMPLPAEPEIYKCNFTIFETMKMLTERKERASDEKGGGLGSLDSDSETPPEIEILFHKELGIHNLTVIKAYTASGFANYTSEFIRSVGLTPMSYPKAELLAQAYIERDINYFVLDIIDLNQDISSPQPLIYIFDSSSVYYPMEITSLTGGNSKILLFIITPYYYIKGPYEIKEETSFNTKTTEWIEEKFIELKPPHSPVKFEKITSTVVNTETFHYYSEEKDIGKSFDPDIHYIYDFFRNNTMVKIAVYEYDGPVKMKGDISVSEYSDEKIKEDEWNDIKQNAMYVACIPIIVLLIAIIIVIIYISKKSNK